jgi:hypothetical protein
MIQGAHLVVKPESTNRLMKHLLIILMNVCLFTVDFLSFFLEYDKEVLQYRQLSVIILNPSCCRGHWQPSGRKANPKKKQTSVSSKPRVVKAWIALGKKSVNMKKLVSARLLMC